MQDTTLTFAELHARANQLAHHLIDLGAAPERPVGILMSRSLDLFTGLLAILKSGSAYVPMDPEYPADRLAIMAGDSKVRSQTMLNPSSAMGLKTQPALSALHEECVRKLC
jgi:non-ribosomal peptide synthetase component F